MKHLKFRVTDEEGNKYITEEISDDFVEEEQEVTDEDEFVSEEQFMDDEPGDGEGIHDEDSLTSEEISALKQLVPVIGKLMALVSTNDEDESIEDDFEEKKEEITDDEPIDGEEGIGDDFEEEKEEIIDTDNVKDSFGAIEKKSKTKDSSGDDIQNEIANTWANHYKQKA